MKTDLISTAISNISAAISVIQSAVSIPKPVIAKVIGCMIIRRIISIAMCVLLEAKKISVKHMNMKLIDTLMHLPGSDV